MRESNTREFTRKLVATNEADLYVGGLSVDGFHSKRIGIEQEKYLTFWVEIHLYMGGGRSVRKLSFINFSFILNFPLNCNKKYRGTLTK